MDGNRTKMILMTHTSLALHRHVPRYLLVIPPASASESEQRYALLDRALRAH
jgi:hypothetical protein